MDKQPLIHLDMDSVISDFMYAYSRIEMQDSKEKFAHAVMNERIFTNLPFMPNAEKLLRLLCIDLAADVEILSSLGTWDPVVSKQSELQKKEWLEKKLILFPTNFVHTWALKKNYARPYSIMIDDRADVIETYITAGGRGVVYVADDFDNMQRQITDIYYELKG